MEILNNIKKLITLRGKGVPLTEFRRKQGLIVNVVFGDKLFEKLISVGICPGEKIKVLSELPDSIIVEIENKKLALGKSIAKNIKVL